jgi:large subunit ribosomal protein L4
MAKVDVFSIEKKKVGDIELVDEVFGAKVNTALFYEVVKAQLASRRRGTHKSLTKAEVRGGGKKPWKQKHTGRARSGSIRNPHWVGGGTAFGPKPRDYSYTPPKKVRQGALRSALSLRLRDKQLTVIDGFSFDKPKTKQMEKFLETFGTESALIVDVENKNLMLSTRNLAKAKFLPNVGLNVYDVLRYKHLYMTKAAVAEVVTKLDKAGASK